MSLPLRSVEQKISSKAVEGYAERFNTDTGNRMSDTEF